MAMDHTNYDRKYLTLHIPALFVENGTDSNFKTGYNRPLELNDMWLVNPERSAFVLSEKLNASFARRRDAV